MNKGSIFHRLQKLWLTNFWTALAVLVSFKIIQMWVTILSPDTLGSEPIYRLLLKSFLIFGSDILGAALFAIGVTLICLPFLLKGLKRTSTALCVTLQGGHALFALFSFVCTITLGGPLNKQAIDLTLMGESDGGSLFNGAIFSTITDHLTPLNLILTLLVITLTGFAVLFAPYFYRWFKGKRLIVTTAILTLETLFTMAVLPYLHSGEIAEIRIYTNGLEKSPLIEFTWSYIRSDHIDMGLIDDEFQFSFAGKDQVANSTLPPLSQALPQKTNVLMISMESVGATYVEANPSQMPFFRELQKKPCSYNLADHYSTWSLTTKALFSIFCSELPYPTYKPEPLINPAIPCKSLPEVLHDRGYFTAFITSQDLAYDRQLRFYKHRKLDLIWDKKNMPGAENAWHSIWGIDDRYAIDKMFEVIEEPRDKPFFMLYMMTTGHNPFLSIKEHADNPLGDRQPEHMREIRFTDTLLKDIFERLEKSGQIDNTLVVIFSDHGTGHGRYLGRSAWQPVIKVPALMHGPQIKKSADNTGLVTSHIDIAPTVLGLLGLPIPCTMKGRNLLTEADHRLAIFGGRPPKWHLGLTDENWKFIWEDKSIEMLFDLSNDPGEYNNLAGKYPERVNFYKNKINEWSAFSSNLIENYGAILKRTECSP